MDGQPVGDRQDRLQKLFASPDADVLIGAEFRPFYPGDRGKDLGVESWPPQKWEIGGGTVWGFVSYDPELDLLFYGDARIDEPGLMVPHPRLHQRGFVLEPLRRIAPDFVHPVLGRSVAALARDAAA